MYAPAQAFAKTLTPISALVYPQTLTTAPPPCLPEEVKTQANISLCSRPSPSPRLTSGTSPSPSSGPNASLNCSHSHIQSFPSQPQLLIQRHLQPKPWSQPQSQPQPQPQLQPRPCSSPKPKLCLKSQSQPEIQTQSQTMPPPMPQLYFQRSHQP